MKDNTTIICGNSKIADSFRWNSILEKSQELIQNEFNPNIFECKWLCAFSVSNKYICCHPTIDEEMIKVLETCVGAYYNCKAEIVVDRNEYTYIVSLNF